MKATRAVFKGSEITPKLAIEKVDCPEGELEDGEILGRILVATICGSDLHTVQGKRKEQVPSILGHEGVVEIVKHQRRNSDLKVGDRITFHVANCCYQCDHCRTGLPQKCVNLFKVYFGNTSTVDKIIMQSQLGPFPKYFSHKYWPSQSQLQTFLDS